MNSPVPRDPDAAQQARRQRVIDAAMALGLDGGYEAVQMRDVAARADVAMGTVYRYFTSKDHLLAAALVHWVEQLDARLAQVPAQGDAAAGRVIDVLDRALRAMGRQPQLVGAVFVALASPDPAAIECQQQVSVLMEGIITRAIGEPQPPDLGDRARILGHVWYSALVGWVNGWSNMGRVHDELVVAVGLLLPAATSTPPSDPHPMTRRPGILGYGLAMPTAIEVRALSKHFGPVHAVDDLSFEVTAGRVTGFLGPNGSGKTTTLRILLGLVSASAGAATFGGRRYVDLDHPIHHVGAVLEATSFHPSRRAEDHLHAVAIAAKLPLRRVDETLELVGLAGEARRRVGKFSLGMRQRLQLATALLGDPEILILDEPANGLDPQGIQWLRTFIRHRASLGHAVLVSSHLLSEMEETVDDVVIVSHGRLVLQTTLADLASRGGTRTGLRIRSPELPGSSRCSRPSPSATARSNRT